MFQLKSRLERLKMTQTHDSLGASGEDRSDTAEDDMIGLEGTGDADEHVVVDPNGDVCDGKAEGGNRTLRAQFGRRRSHNEELCVASCGCIHGRQRFLGSEAPNGVRVSQLSLSLMPAHCFFQDIYNDCLSN